MPATSKHGSKSVMGGYGSERQGSRYQVYYQSRLSSEWVGGIDNSDTPGSILIGAPPGNIVQLDAFRDPSAVLMRECDGLFVQMHDLRTQIDALGGGGASEIEFRERAYRERFDLLREQIADRFPHRLSSRVLNRVREVLQHERSQTGE